MTYDELIEVLNGLPGRWVEVTARVQGKGEGGRWIASFSGVVDDLGEPSDTHQTVYWREDVPKPRPGSITVWREGFEGAEVKGTDRTLDEVVEEDDGPGDATHWELTIRQVGVVLELFIYLLPDKDRTPT